MTTSAIMKFHLLIVVPARFLFLPMRNGLLLFSLISMFFGVLHAENPKRNVLWLYLEDVSGWFSCYGDKVIQTPNIDALAAEGTRFDRFYVPSGICSTTRSAIATGMMQTTIGAHNHRSSRKSFRGKTFSPPDLNFLAEDVIPLPIRFRGAGWWTFNEGGKDDYNFVHDLADWYDDVFYRRAWAPDRFLSGASLAEKAEGQPFFGQLQLGGGKLNLMPWSKHLVTKTTDRATVSVPPYYPDIPEVREQIANHYDCLLVTDSQVGQIVKKLKDDGVYDNTVIFLFSDHGYVMHRHKQFIYEGGIRMPLIVTGPGIPAGKVRDDLVSGIDVTATSLGAAGLPVPIEMEGRDVFSDDYQPRDFVIAARDRADYTIDKIRAVVTPRFKYLRNYLVDRPYMQPNYRDSRDFSVVIQEYRKAGKMNEDQLAFYGDDRPEEELYDLSSDPHEIRNLADDPRFTKVLKQHRQLLENWIAKTGDRGQEPESDTGLKAVLHRWGEKCVNPEYDRVR